MNSGRATTGIAEPKGC